MPIVIRKKVTFDFLGEEYKDAYLTFQSIPLKDFEELVVKIKSVENDNTKAAQFMLDALKHYFMEGNFPDMEKVVKEDLDGLDPESVIRCFQLFTGQEINKERGTEAEPVADLKAE
jgi:hypothetical protein